LWLASIRAITHEPPSIEDREQTVARRAAGRISILRARSALYLASSALNLACAGLFFAIGDSSRRTTCDSGGCTGPTGSAARIHADVLERSCTLLTCQCLRKTPVPQLTLFDPGERVLADDERGRISYIAGLIDAATAAAWFSELRDAVTWRSERRMMYDREVDVPRLMGHYRLDPPPLSIPAPILQAAAHIVERLAVPFNSVGLNRYRDGRDSVAPHNDHLNELQRGHPIALLSLGATRRMTVRAKEKPARVIHADLEAGSLFVMDYATQIHYTHAIPKTADVVGERISLAFRVKRRNAGATATDAGFYK
jgi:alkylated DNA repair dioxygenase AlkB